MMNAHEHYENLLMLFVAGQLDGADRMKLESHLAICGECQVDLALWTDVSAQILAANRSTSAPPALVDSAMIKIQGQEKSPNIFRRAWQLLSSQTSLVQREMWPASAAVMALGIIVSLVSKHVEAIYFLAPLVAAASLSILFGPEFDPAYELTIATPTSPWKVLLARMSIVSSYNLLLMLAAGLALLVMIPPELLGQLILGWLAPMAFLSTLALLLSLWIGTSNAIVLTYMLWMAQYIPYQSIGAWMVSTTWSSVILAYQRFWQSTMLLFLLSVFLMGAALWSANRPIGSRTLGAG